jgi:hypothetical protein
MITGLVTVDREAIIRLAVRGPVEREFGIDAVMDAGFDGWLSLTLHRNWRYLTVVDSCKRPGQIDRTPRE